MKFTVRRNGFTLEGIDGNRDIKFSNLAGAHTNSQYDDPNRDPQRAITIWFDDDVIADGLQENDFLVGRAADTYHKDKNKQPLGDRYFIKFIAYVDKIVDKNGNATFALKKRVNRDGREIITPKIMAVTDNGAKMLEPDSFSEVDTNYISNIDISFRGWKYDLHKPCAAVINELWFTPDATAGGRNDYDDDSLEQKYAGVPLSDE